MSYVFKNILLLVFLFAFFLLPLIFFLLVTCISQFLTAGTNLPFLSVNRTHIRYAFGAGAIAIQIVWTQPVILSFVLAATHLLKKTWFKMVKLKNAYKVTICYSAALQIEHMFFQESFKMELVNHLAVNEWGWVCYKELWRSRRALSVEAVGRGG